MAVSRLKMLIAAAAVGGAALTACSSQPVASPTGSPAAGVITSTIVADPVTSTVRTTVVSTVPVTETVTPPPVTNRMTVTTKPPAVTVTAEPAAPAEAFGDGTFIVGKDVQPGTYQASGTGNDCYWARLDKTGGIIDNDFGTVATIQDGDFTFKSNRCGSWTKVG